MQTKMHYRKSRTGNAVPTMRDWKMQSQNVQDWDVNMTDHTREALSLHGK